MNGDFVLREGQRLTPFASIELSPGPHHELLLEWIYPVDATPSQVLKLSIRN